MLFYYTPRSGPMIGNRYEMPPVIGSINKGSTYDPNNSGIILFEDGDGGYLARGDSPPILAPAPFSLTFSFLGEWLKHNSNRVYTQDDAGLRQANLDFVYNVLMSGRGELKEITPGLIDPYTGNDIVFMTTEIFLQGQYQNNRDFVDHSQFTISATAPSGRWRLSNGVEVPFH